MKPQSTELPNAVRFDVTHRPAGSDIYWPIGVSINGMQPVWLNLLRGHIAIIACRHQMPGLKLGAAVLGYFHTSSQLQFCILVSEEQETSFGFLNGLPHLFLAGVSGERTEEELSARLAEEISLRAGMFSGARMASFHEFNRQAGPEERLPLLIVIIDDRANPEQPLLNSRAFELLISEGWRCGFRLVTVMENAHSEAWRAGNTWKVCLGGRTHEISRSVLQAANIQAAFSLADARGLAYVRDPDGLLVETQRYWLDSRHLSAMVKARLTMQAVNIQETNRDSESSIP